MMPNREGQRFDDYHQLHLLGEGTFGEVYAAEHIYDHEQVAIKIIKHQLSPTTLPEFMREARMFRLKHPHIIPLLDFGIAESEQLPFLVMALAANGTLLQRHKRGTRLDLHLVVTYVEQIASALHYAHKRRLIHRDVKPANVLLGAQNELLLSDFGIVAIAHSERSMRTQDVVGTAAYMAPEQIMGKPQPASDQYALAVMAYEWLCGTPPFRGNQIELYAHHLHAAPDAPRLHNPQLPNAVETVLLKALAKDPVARFPSIEAFAHALTQANPTSTPTIYPSPPIAATQPARPTPQPIPNDTKEGWINKGVALGNLKRYEEALDAFNRAIQLDPNYALAYNGKGVALGNLKRYEEALDAFNRAIQLDPNYALAYNGKGVALGDLKRYEEALDACNWAIALDPNFAFAYYSKGNALRNLKRYEEALNAFNQAIALDPNYALAYNNKGYVLGGLKRYEEALNAFNRAIQLDPNYAIAYRNKGVALGNLKRYEEALDAYNRAIALDLNYAIAYNGKGNALNGVKRYEEALDAYNRAIQLDLNYAMAYNNKGAALNGLKRYEEALDAYNRAIQLDLNYAIAYRNKGWVLDNLKRYEEALDAYNRAIALDPNFAMAYNNKGAALDNLKRYEEALDAYNWAIALDPNFAIAYHNKGIALRNLKRPEDARAAFAMARQLGYNG